MEMTQENLTEKREYANEGEFEKKDLRIISQRYRGFDIGLQVFNDIGDELKLVSIDITDENAAKNPDIAKATLEHLLDGLPEKIDYSTFKEKVEEIADILFDGNVQLGFADEQCGERYISLAIQCLKSISFEPAKEEGKTALEKVAGVLGYNGMQLRTLLKEELGE